MCIIAQRGNREGMSVDFLGIDIIKKLIDEIHGSFIIKPIVHFSGGEPLIHQDFSEICLYCADKKVPWSLTTNGFFLQSFSEIIVRHGCKCVNVSIDGLEDIHNSIRGSSESFQRAIEGIMAIARLKKEKKKFPLLAVTCTINDKNYKYLEDVANFFRSMPINSLTFQHLSFGKDFIFGEDFNYETAKNIDTEILKETVRKINRSRYSIPVSFVPKIRLPDIHPYYKELSHRFNNSCVNPWLVAEIKPNGRVMVCHEEVGDIKSATLKNIWNNARSINVRRLVNRGLIDERCLRCCHRQYY